MKGVSTQEVLDQRRSLLIKFKLMIAEMIHQRNLPCKFVFCDLFEFLSDAEVEDQFGHLTAQAIRWHFGIQKNDLFHTLDMPCPDGTGFVRTQASDEFTQNLGDEDEVLDDEPFE